MASRCSSAIAAKLGRAPARTPIRAGQELIAAFTSLLRRRRRIRHRHWNEMLLLLLDVDGTLFLTDDPLVGEATAEAAREVWGIHLEPDCLARSAYDGGLALGQARSLARRAGVSEPEIDAGLARWCALHAERYLARLAEADTSGWRAADAAAATLTTLQA